MGQVNCQQCIMPYIEDVKIRQTKTQPPQQQPPAHRLHRVNILSKHRNSHQLLFSKKYSTQITREDIQQQQTNLTKSIFIKEKAVVLLESKQQQQIYRIEIERGGKVIVGTSMNCDFHIPTSVNPFKVSLEYVDDEIVINDMGIGGGAFIKSPTCVFHHSAQSLKQLFLINNSYLQLTLKRSFNHGSNTIQLTIKSITQQQQEQQFSFNLIDILLKKQNKRKLLVNNFQQIEFEVMQTQDNGMSLCFHKINSCWRYIGQRMLLEENHILSLGSQEFMVKRILSPSSLSQSSDIKIVDFDDDSD